MSKGGPDTLARWMDAQDRYYPDTGWTANVYSEGFNHSHLESIDRLVTGLEQLKLDGTIKEVSCWWTDFKRYVEENKNFTSWRQISVEEQTFYTVLSDFLFSREGAQFKNDFKFTKSLTCNMPAPQIKVSKFSISYHVMTVSTFFNFMTQMSL